MTFRAAILAIAFVMSLTAVVAGQEHLARDSLALSFAKVIVINQRCRSLVPVFKVLREYATAKGIAIDGLLKDAISRQMVRTAANLRGRSEAEICAMASRLFGQTGLELPAPFESDSVPRKTQQFRL
jgi:hypothetical protein